MLICLPPPISSGHELEHMAKILIGQQQNVKHNPSLCHKLIWSTEHRSKAFIMGSQITVCSPHSLVAKNEATLDLYSIKSNRSQTEYCQTSSKTSHAEMGASKDHVLGHLDGSDG